MKHVQKLLVLAGEMFEELANEAETGNWPSKRCKYCRGTNEGSYYDYHYFQHAEHCFTRKNRQFQELLQEMNNA